MMTLGALSSPSHTERGELYTPDGRSNELEGVNLFSGEGGGEYSGKPDLV